MPRAARASVGGICCHVLNRGNGHATVYHGRSDYEDFIVLMVRACDRVPMRVLGYCLMPNHFHLALWPREDGDMGRWMQWLMTSHVRRHHGRRQTDGHLWQGRYKSFPVQNDTHLATVLRYVERNPLRAGLVSHAADWPWSSHRWWRSAGRPSFLYPTSDVRSPDWPSFVDEPQTIKELEALRRSVVRGTPFGGPTWTRRTAAHLGLESTLRPLGRPRSAKRGQSPF